MPHSWLSPPTRRELTLVLFSLSVFVLFYNLDSTLHLFGFSSTSHSSSLFHPFSSSSSLVGGGLPIGPDGRVPEAYRDVLEKEIFGDWDWEEGRIAGVNEAEEERIKDKEGWVGDKGTHADGQPGGRDRYVQGEGMTGMYTKWLQGVGQRRYLYPQDVWDRGQISVGSDGRTVAEGVAGLDLVTHWTEETVPRAKVLKHTPGYTILDNVVLANRTMYLVSDEPSSMPSTGSIASSRTNTNDPPTAEDWQILYPIDAVAQFGTYGGRIHGVTFLSFDTPSTSSPQTILSLQRLYSSLSKPQQTLSPPYRLVLPSIPTFTIESLEQNTPSHPRSPIGIHPATLKGAYPSLAGVLYREDWIDFVEMTTPVVFDRVVIVDRGAATRAQGAGIWSNNNGLDVNPEIEKDWLEPVRQNLAGMLEDEALASSGGKKQVVTYVSNQRRLSGADSGRVGRLRDEDHTALVEGLKGLGRNVKVNVVEEDMSWKERMAALVGSTVVLGAHGDHLADAVYMKPSPQTALVEFFPDGTFSNAREEVVRSIGMHYVAFVGTQKHTAENLPPVSRPEFSTLDIHIDAQAVVQAIKDELSRRS